MQTTSFLQTETILQALRFALAKDGFGKDANRKKAASDLIKELTGRESVSGRRQQLVALLQKGATLQQMINGTGASRRTVFRYLNHFEAAGVDIQLEDGKYRLKKSGT